MKRKFPISVFIICRDEEDRIGYTIGSVVGWADEVIVVDSGSTDATVEVAKQCGASQVVFHEWRGYGQQKSFAESLCKNRWVLNLDADEEVSRSMQQHIQELLENGEVDQHSAYKLTVKFMPRFKKITEFSPGPELQVVRLYDKTKATFKLSAVHDSVVVREGRVGALRGKLLHRCFRSFSHALAKINHYTSMQAADMYEKGKNPSMLRILAEPFWTFCKSYFINKYMFLGIEGVLMSIIYSMQRTLRLVKAKEIFLQKEWE